jgi:hypothetical protein
MRKKIIDIITENNFKEISSTPTTMYSLMFDTHGNGQIVSRALCKVFRYVDDEYSSLETGITLKALYYEQFKDLNNEIYIYKANRLVFDGKIDTEEEFKILLKMLSL